MSNDWTPAPDLRVGATFTMTEPRPLWQRLLSLFYSPWLGPRVRRFTITESTYTPAASAGPTVPHGEGSLRVRAHGSALENIAARNLTDKELRDHIGQGGHD